MVPTIIEYQSFDILDNGRDYEVQDLIPGGSGRKFDTLAEAKAAIDAAALLMPIFCLRLKMIINYGPVIEERNRTRR